MSTGYVYDDIFLKHDLTGHPENSHRLSAIMDYLVEHHLLPRIKKIACRLATEEELCQCHHPSLVQLVKNLCSEGYAQIDADTYVNEFSYEAAASAVGGMIDLTSTILKGTLSNGIVLARPPGHHATRMRSMGFCIFNTIAIGARTAVNNNQCKRAAIVDIDVHHGNGTQDIFYKDPAIMYISTHQYPHYPGTGTIHERGDGAAERTKVNIPFPPYAGDHCYREAFMRIVLPLLERFHPAFIFVSVGFDAHHSDPLSGITLSLNTYNWLCRSLIGAAKNLCSGRIIFCLEGGYSLPVLAAGVGNIVRGLIGEQAFDDPFPAHTSTECDVADLLSSIEDLHGL
jgi:acetoin utilization deacetylase AcuC-like enzyme